jgi:hypothetical protein
MNSLRDAVIDERRWPKMFQTLRRVGLYSSCGCVGCGACQAAARWFVLGVARGARQRARAGVLDSPRRRATYDRAFGGRRFGFLVDPWPQPTIVDLAAEPAGEEEDEGGRWLDAINSRNWPGPQTRERLQNLGTDLQGDVWKGPVTFMDVSSVPKEAGLYLIAWDHGAYLGKATKDATTSKGIFGRVDEHRRAYEEFSFRPPSEAQRRNIRVYWLETPKGSSKATTSNKERLYLNRILGRTPDGATKDRRLQPQYAALGFRNRDELELRGSAE